MMESEARTCELRFIGATVDIVDRGEYAALKAERDRLASEVDFWKRLQMKTDSDLYFYERLSLKW